MEPEDASGLRTLLVGIDGASEEVLGPLVDAERVPALADLRSQGTSAPLQSSIPPWTPSAWPSLFTGTNPGKHGVFGFLAFDGYDWTVVDGTHVRERALWEYLDRQGVASVVVNVPVTHPPSEFDGALIPGYTAPESPACHPEGTLRDVRDAIGGYRVYPDEDGGRPTLTDYEAVIEQRGRAFRHLAGEYDPGFGFLQFQVTDTVCHDHPGDRSTLGAVYEAVDEQIRATLEACDPDTVVVASDHGIGPLAGREFRSNRFLERRGFLRSTTEGDGMPTWATVRDRRLKRGTGAEAGDGQSLLGRIGGLLASVGVTSQRVGSVLSRVGLADVVAARLPDELVRSATERVAFRDSRAYVRSRIECGVRVNLAGREPDGTVDPEDYESVRDDLVEALSCVRTPDGDPVFETVDRREAFYEGPEIDGAPDVVTVPDGFEHFLSAQLREEVFGDPTEPWNHKRDGVLLLAGDAVGSDPLDAPRIFDVAPTILATFGIPRDERMDGAVVGPVDAAGVRSYPDPERPDRRTIDDTEVTTRLEDLGYIER